jgi:transcriptional regulator with XRE-family HTH domain
MIKFQIKQRPKSMPQKDVVRRSGMRQAYISQIENNSANPSIHDYERYLNACGKTLTVKKLKKDN